MFKLFKKRSQFSKITAEQIAKENHLDYIGNPISQKTNQSENFTNSYYAKEDKYILLYPPNDGMPTCPFKWYTSEKVLILNNQNAFKSITNLDDIIIQMIELYTKYIDSDVFIASYGFAIKLKDTIHSDYTGSATLTLTDDSIRNAKVDSSDILEAKKYFLNDFLDHYIGWNFGVIINKSEKLKKAINEFNTLVIQKGLREYAGTGFDVWTTKDVQPYDLKKT